MPKLILSLAIPCYNGAAFVPGCLSSVARSVAELPAADRERVEVIFCDNHSTDDSLHLAQSLPPGCAYRIVQPPRHLENRTLNWHHALSAAEGQWMMMLHADDLLAPGALGGILRAAGSAPARRAVLLPGRIRTFTDPARLGRLRPLWPFAARLLGETLRRRVLPFLCPFVPFTPMRRSAYERIGGLNAEYELVQDLELWVRLLAEGDALYTPFELGYWREHPFSSHYARIFAKEHFRLASKLPSLVPGLPASAQRQAARLAHAKTTRWLSRAEADRLAREHDSWPAETFVPESAVPAFLARSERSMGLLLYALRGAALFRR